MNKGVHANPFGNAELIATYAENTPRKVPGLADLHRMTMLLLQEQANSDARILVVGAGGGLEVKAIGEAQPGWAFVGVDPSAAMLDLARRNVGSIADRVQFIEGTVDAAPVEAFDGATCLLTLHFLDKEERLHTLTEIQRRLKPGARLVVAHHSAGRDDAVGWLTRSAAFADRADQFGEQAAASGRAMAKSLPLLSPHEEEELLREAGFVDVELFYAAFSFRGWVVSRSLQ
ncbi:class I SAM-dependent methyltransferase [Rhizobium sp. CFBP 8762]|uniref:class I SAM-dependent methyltransferase n=1 Tax=Rhizobium sp. CFBP 8762 TaxID=2775279 RepID=UPI00178064B8|nr:class I SAM-dependent methyltransferase [Rhizobium sp. CFBP 8762]MBD8554562.1 class I SAM-dependent methyltransferase [Rhizobium sp. CFBP 8762]